MIPQEGLNFEYNGNFYVITERWSVTLKYKHIKTGRIIRSTVEKFLQNEKYFNYV